MENNLGEIIIVERNIFGDNGEEIDDDDDDEDLHTGDWIQNESLFLPV